MMIKNARRWAPKGLWRYAVALAASAGAFGLRELMHPLLESHMPALFFTITAVLICFKLGIRPAILVVLIGIPLADYYFVPPYANFSYIDRSDLILFASFPCVTLLFLFMIEWLRRTQHEARLFTEVARSRHDMLVRAEKRRKEGQIGKLAMQRLLHSLEGELNGDPGRVVYLGKVNEDASNDTKIYNEQHEVERFVTEEGIYEIVRLNGRKAHE